MTLSFETSSVFFYNLCKIAIFGAPCTDKPVTIVDPVNWTGATTFDLLNDSNKIITLPTLTITPASCYSTTWNVHRTDGVDMVSI